MNWSTVSLKMGREEYATPENQQGFLIFVDMLCVAKIANIQNENDICYNAPPHNYSSLGQQQIICIKQQKSNKMRVVLKVTSE